MPKNLRKIVLVVVLEARLKKLRSDLKPPGPATVALWARAGARMLSPSGPGTSSSTSPHFVKSPPASKPSHAFNLSTDFVLKMTSRRRHCSSSSAAVAVQCSAVECSAVQCTADTAAAAKINSFSRFFRSCRGTSRLFSNFFRK